jgi:hypothetical protein
MLLAVPLMCARNSSHDLLLDMIYGPTCFSVEIVLKKKYGISDH